MKALSPEMNALARGWLQELIRQGKTETEVAVIVGRSQPVVNRILDGAGTTVDVAMAAARALGKGEDFLAALDHGSEKPGTKGVGTTRPGGSVAALPQGDGRWQVLAGAEPQFRRHATKVRARTKTEDELREVEAILDMASDNVPEHYSGREPGSLTRDEVRALYADAEADFRDEPAPARAPAPTPPPAAPKGTMAERAASALAASKPKRR